MSPSGLIVLELSYPPCHLTINPSIPPAFHSLHFSIPMCFRTMTTHWARRIIRSDISFKSIALCFICLDWLTFFWHWRASKDHDIHCIWEAFVCLLLFNTRYTYT